MPPDKKIKNVPVTESQKLFLVSNIKSRNVLARKKKILKFHENANALSTSKIKNGQSWGRSAVLMSFTGRPQTTGAFKSPTVSFFIGMPAWYCPITPVELIIHSSILINRGVPAMTDSDFSTPKKKLSQLAILEVWILSELRTIYKTNIRSRNIFVFLLNEISVVPLPASVFGETGTEAIWVSEDLSGTGVLIFFFILCFFDILP